MAEHAGPLAHHFDDLEQQHEARKRGEDFDRALRDHRSQPRDDPYSRSYWYGGPAYGHPLPYGYRVYWGGGHGGGGKPRPTPRK